MEGYRSIEIARVSSASSASACSKSRFFLEEWAQWLTSQAKRRADQAPPGIRDIFVDTYLKLESEVLETVSSLLDLIGGMKDMSKFLKYAAMLALVAGFIANLPDIKRYIKMSSM
jgi:hypothetical protein